MNWRPAKTAPQDWTHILVYDHGSESVCEAYFSDEGNWVRANLWDNSEDSLLLDVTHWMPLPDPPRRAVAAKPSKAKRAKTTAASEAQK